MYGVGRVDGALAYYQAALPVAESAADTAQPRMLMFGQPYSLVRAIFD